MLGDSATPVVIGILGVFASGVGLCQRLNGWGGSRRASIRLLLNVRSISDIVRLSDKGKPFSDKVAICRGRRVRRSCKQEDGVDVVMDMQRVLGLAFFMV